MEAANIYVDVGKKADEIESELKRLRRWQEKPLPESKYENMGAFGANTMAFEQWIQFILLVNIRAIIEDNDDFPEESQVGAYAVRNFDGDTEAEHLTGLLIALDDMVNNRQRSDLHENNSGPPPLSSLSDCPLPSVLYQLIEVLPTFEGDDLEAQLQTFDAFLVPGDAGGREEISRLLYGAASKATPSNKRLRIMKAAKAVASGGQAAAPYNHDEAMRKYREAHKKSFPDAEQ